MPLQFSVPPPYEWSSYSKTLALAYRRRTQSQLLHIIMAALTDAEIQTVLDAWPADDAGLPGSVQTALLHAYNQAWHGSRLFC